MKKFLAVLSVVLVAAMLLTACGAGKTETAVSAGNSEYAGMGDGKTLVYWCEWNESETQWDVYKDTIARFEADTGYKVDVQHLGRDVATLYPAAIDAGEVIDVFDMNSTMPAKGYSANIQEYVDKYGLDEMVLPIYAKYEESVSLDDEGNWYGVPSQPFFGGVFYNKDIFEAAGITAEPTTWAEFMDCCEKIKAAGYDPMCIDDAYVEGVWSYQFGLALGEDAFNDLKRGTGDKWNATLDVAKAIEEMASKGYFSASTGGAQFPAAQNGEFAMGTAAMYGWDGSWVCNEVHDITGDEFNWGFMLWPCCTNDEYKVIETSCQQICVSTTSQDPAGAALLLKYMIDATTCEGLRDKCQCIPVCDGLDWPGALTCVQEAAKNAETVYGWCLASRAEGLDPDVNTLCTTYFHELMGGTKTAQEFVDHMVSGS